MKPICIPCQRFFRMVKSGYYFIEGMPMRSDTPAGTELPDEWKPYKVWVGDRWRCEGCGAEIISGVGRSPLAEHYQPEFPEVVARTGADQFQVNDC